MNDRTYRVQITEARNLAGCEGARLRVAAGVTFATAEDSGYAGLTIEQVIIHPESDDGPERTELSLWHGDSWMFGLDLAPDEVVHVIGVARELPDAPDREGWVRVHGTWSKADAPHIAWTGGHNYP